MNLREEGFADTIAMVAATREQVDSSELWKSEPAVAGKAQEDL